MTDESTPDSSQISVAELLARNGRAPEAGNGRRRRGGAGSIPVAELTGELPVVGTTASHSANPADPTSEPGTDPMTAVRPAPTPGRRDTPTAGGPLAGLFGQRGANGSRRGSNGSPAADPPVVDLPTEVIPAVPADAAKGQDAAKAQDGTKAKEAAARPDAAAAPAVPAKPDVEPAAEVPPARGKKGDSAPADADAATADTDADADDDDADRRGGLRQWAALVGQVVVAVVAGALLFKGFGQLWDMLPVVALVLAVLVIVGLVALVRILRKTDDLLSIVIAIVVGIFVTMGPLVFLLSGS